jgi:glycosyltransferase involved in cell wall biosynthesis
MNTNKGYKILIATGIYPPEIGGPSFYAKMLSETFSGEGHAVSVATYGALKKIPTGLRHFIYALKIIPSVLTADFVVALDTFSVAVPAVFVSRLFGKKIIVRVGGDFLWEEYVERTHEKIFLSEFYKKHNEFSKKEKYIFRLTKYVLKNASSVVFSTEWQKNIFTKVYCPDASKVSVIENVYGKQAQRNIIPKEKIIISPSRDRFLKNKSGLDTTFSILEKRYLDIAFDKNIYSHDELKKRLLQSYCLVVPSFSEVSPNIVLDALSYGIPCVVTIDCGIYDRIKDLVVWVDPKSPQSIADGIATLLDAGAYNTYMSKISKFSFTHTPKDIAAEFISLFEKLK